MIHHYGPQLINLLAAVLLLLAFAMLARRRILSLINLYAAQGLVLCLSTALVGYLTGQSHLYWSALLTLVLALWVWAGHRGTEPGPGDRPGAGCRRRRPRSPASARSAPGPAR